jgi:SAM-dependent methyltransferase
MSIDSPRLWNDLAAEYDRTRAFPGDLEHEVPRRIARILGERGARRVLDVGCGTGRFALRFAAEGLDVVGVDRAPEMLARCAAKRGDARLPLVRGDAAALPFASAAFDAAFTSHVLHVVPSVDALASALARVLAPRALLADADTTYAPRPVTRLVLERVMPRLVEAWRPWPTAGGRSRTLDLFERAATALGAGDVEILALAEWTVPRTLRTVLAEVRSRTWSTLRVHAAERVGAAADAAERDLLAAGHDLDAVGEDREGVRLLLARARG